MLQLRNFVTVVQGMAAAVQGASDQLLDLTVGSVTRAILEATASVYLWLQYLILIVLQGTRLATSTGPQCDSFGADFDFTRLPATNATGAVTFSRFVATAAALIPAINGTTIGAQVRTADGTQTFNVTVDTTNALWNAAMNGYLIPAGTLSATVPVVAVNAGTQGNILAGAINLIVGSIPFVNTATNALAYTNGINAETDAAFKLRFANFIATRAQSTVAAIIYAITSIAQNITTSISEFVNTAMVFTPGSFVAFVDDGTGNPSAATIQLASTAVNLTRACGIMYAVQPPSLVTANVSYTLTVGPGIVKANILAPVAAAVTAFINALPMGAPMPYTRIAQVIYDSSNGVTNVNNLLVNGGTADLGGATNQVVRAGTVTGS
jgi:hypothetical protein